MWLQSGNKLINDEIRAFFAKEKEFNFIKFILILTDL